MDSAGKAQRSRGPAKALVTTRLKETRELMMSGSELVQQNLNKVYDICLSLSASMTNIYL